MAERTYLHVGTPNSGTGYLHGVLWHNADALRDHGFLLPGRMVAHYAAARSLTRPPDRQRPTPDDADETSPAEGTAARPDELGHPDRTEHSWSRITRQTNRWKGPALIGHPLLASATDVQAAAARHSIDGDVHLLITARALQLQAVPSWQDQVKGGLGVTLDAFLTGLRDQDRSRGRRFWRVHDIAELASRWRADSVPPAHVHIVPVPPLSRPTDREHPVAGPAQVWARYAGALGLDPSAYDSDLAVRTAPLGPVELELLRRVHERRDPRFTDPRRHVWTRQLLANNVLARRPATPLRLPDDALAWLTERSDAILSRLESAGYSVDGDLADLDRSGDEPGARLTTDVTDDEVAEAAAWTILRLQEELVHREPVVAPPPVGPDDGIDAVLELLEHIRAADTAVPPRPAPEPDNSRVARIRRALPARRGH